MNTSHTIPLAHGFDLNASGQSLGELHRTFPAGMDSAELRHQFAEDGYLYMPDFLDRMEVFEAREQVLTALEEKGLLDSSRPKSEAVKNQDSDMGFLANPVLAMEFMTSIAKNNQAMQRLLYSGRIIQFFQRFFSEEVRHFDFTWVRTMGKGFGTDPHCDIVYMGRGSSRLCTLWTPFSDISREIGGLMILENSHKRGKLLRKYLSRDVDNYCENGPEADKVISGEIPWTWGGVLSNNPSSLCDHLDGRWLSAEFRMGDVLIFGIRTVHASLDNQTPYFRISTDSRYQPASEPVDERWVGENPVGHGREAKRPMIC